MLITKGNTKVPHLIFNMTSAMNCPSRKLGLCQLENPDKCYALKFEKLRKNVKNCHLFQEEFWANMSWHAMAIFIKAELEKAGKSKAKKKLDTNYIRFNTSGDFRNTHDIFRLIDIACFFPKVTFYGYTARKDLFTQEILNALPQNIVVTGSGFMLHNEFRAVKEITPGAITCPGDCSKCNLCKKRLGVVIENKLH